MSEAATQAAVDEPKVPAQPGTEVTSARKDDDLDTLLNEFDTEQPKPSPTVATPEPKTEAADESKVVLEQMRGVLSEHQQRQFRQDMNETVKNVRGDLDPEFFDDDFVEAWLDARARKDTRLQAAWNNRHAKPKEFQKIVEGLGSDFTKKHGKMPDKNATEDRAAVADAVRGSSTSAPAGKAPEYSKMTPGEFQAEKDKLFGG